MKRKGEEYEYTATAPLSVMQSPSAEYKTIELPPPRSGPNNGNSNDNNNDDPFSPFSPPSTNVSWEATRDAMNQLITNATSSSSSLSSLISSMDEMKSAIPDVRKQEETIRSDAKSILSKIRTKIQSSRDQLSKEQEDFINAQKHIVQLETEVSEIQSSQLELHAEESQLRQKIDYYTKQAEEDIEITDEVEFQQKEQVYRLQNQISLHAAVSGINWDFDVGTDVISGEIQVHVNPQNGNGKSNGYNGGSGISSVYGKRFELNRADYSSFELANLLWDMMEA